MYAFPFTPVNTAINTRHFYLVTLRTANGMSFFGSLNGRVLNHSEEGELVAAVWRQTLASTPGAKELGLSVLPTHFIALMEVDLEQVAYAQNIIEEFHRFSEQELQRFNDRFKWHPTLSYRRLRDENELRSWQSELCSSPEQLWRRFLKAERFVDDFCVSIGQK